MYRVITVTFIKAMLSVNVCIYIVNVRYHVEITFSKEFCIFKYTCTPNELPILGKTVYTYCTLNEWVHVPEDFIQTRVSSKTCPCLNTLKVL